MDPEGHKCTFLWPMIRQPLFNHHQLKDVVPRWDEGTATDFMSPFKPTEDCRGLHLSLEETGGSEGETPDHWRPLTAALLLYPEATNTHTLTRTKGNKAGNINHLVNKAGDNWCNGRGRSLCEWTPVYKWASVHVVVFMCFQISAGNNFTQKSKSSNVRSHTNTKVLFPPTSQHTLIDYLAHLNLLFNSSVSLAKVQTSRTQIRCRCTPTNAAVLGKYKLMANK